MSVCIFVCVCVKVLQTDGGKMKERKENKKNKQQIKRDKIVICLATKRLLHKCQKINEPSHNCNGQVNLA